MLDYRGFVVEYSDDILEYGQNIRMDVVLWCVGLNKYCSMECWVKEVL